MQQRTAADNRISRHDDEPQGRDEDTFIAERADALFSEYLADDSRLEAAIGEWLTYHDSEDLNRSLPLFFVQFHKAQNDTGMSDAGNSLHRSLMAHVEPIIKEWASDQARAEWAQMEEAELDHRASARDAA